MRVITGTAKGRRLREPANLDIRPTTDMVKEAMFSILHFDIEGRQVLDLFAGTGQLGIEALSRGAAACTFVDENKESIRIVRENLEHCGMSGQILQTESLGFLERCGKYDVIFLDPPYDSGLCDKALQRIFKFDILSEGGIIMCETARDTTLPPPPPPYCMGKDYRYGKVKLTVFVRQEQ